MNHALKLRYIYYIPKSPPDVEAHDVEPKETGLERIVDDEC